MTRRLTDAVLRGQPIIGIGAGDGTWGLLFMWGNANAEHAIEYRTSVDDSSYLPPLELKGYTWSGEVLIP